MKKCLLCNKKKFLKRFEYFSPPFGETNYFKNKMNYHRYFLTCKNCFHWFSILKFSLKNLYSSEYNKATYSGNLIKNFKKINKLPNKKSDNFYRVKRIVELSNKILSKSKNKTLLDIGSGLGIFPYKISIKGFNCTALDPDASSCMHIRKNLKINTINGDFLKKNIKKKYDFITLNKVIEHVKRPDIMVSKAKRMLNKDGIIYIEVPNATKASKKGKEREEFYVDHLHVFSSKSLTFLIKKIGLSIIKMKEIVEPSGMYTVYAFCKL